LLPTLKTSFLFFQISNMLDNTSSFPSSAIVVEEPRRKRREFFQNDRRNTTISPANPAPSHREYAGRVIHHYPVDRLLMARAAPFFTQLSPPCTFKFTYYPHKTLFRFKRLCRLHTLSTNLFIFLFVYIYFEIENYRCAQHTSTGKAHQPWNAL
jgi:hypothetical protein